MWWLMWLVINKGTVNLYTQDKQQNLRDDNSDVI